MEKRVYWPIISALTISLSLFFIDSTILPVALPTIGRELGASDHVLDWIINCYILAVTVLVITAGRVGDIFGHRRLFVLGLLGFGVASMLCGLASTGEWLVVYRTLQGVSMAFVSPAVIAILIENVPKERIGKSIGGMVAIASFFLAIGPFVGGLFAEYWSWRWIFFINPIFVFVALVLAFRFIPRSEKREESIDFLGFLILAAGTSALVIAMMEGATLGWLSWPTLTLMCVGVLLLVMLRMTTGLCKHPIIDFDLFKNFHFRGGVFTIFFLQWVLMVTIFWPQFLQTSMHFSATKAGLISLLSTLPLLVLAPIAGRIYDRLGAKVPVAIGGWILMFSLFYLYFAVSTLEIRWVFPGLLAYGCGMSFAMTPLMTYTVSQATKEMRGVAAGVYQTIRFAGGALGLALFDGIIVSFRSVPVSAFSAINLLSGGLVLVVLYCTYHYLKKDVA